jgi:hypothetical protein
MFRVFYLVITAMGAGVMLERDEASLTVRLVTVSLLVIAVAWNLERDEEEDDEDDDERDEWSEWEQGYDRGYNSGFQSGRCSARESTYMVNSIMQPHFSSTAQYVPDIVPPQVPHTLAEEGDPD